MYKHVREKILVRKKTINYYIQLTINKIVFCNENLGRAIIPKTDETTAIVPDSGNTRPLKNQKTEFLVKYTEFLKFSATIDDFVSMRDKRHGKLFVQF